MKIAEPLTQLYRQSDPQQLYRLGNIAKFFSALLIVTLIARGTAGATMPLVTVQTPYSGSVEENLQLSGTVSYAGGEPFLLPSGLLVTGVPVQVGQNVKAGDILATFDAAELDRAVASKQAELQQLRIQTAQQAQGDTADPYSAQLAQKQLERAYEETQKTYAEGQKNVERMRQKRNEAAQDLENARNAPLDEGVPQAEAEAQKQAAIEAATQALEAADETLYQAEKAAEDANDAALSAAQSAEDSRNTALHRLEKEEASVAEQNELNRAAAAVGEANAANLQAQLDALLALQQAGACYTAPSSGTLVQLNLKAGEQSPAVGGLLAGEDADFTVCVPLTDDQSEKITVGTVLHISQNKAGGDTTVQHLTEADANGQVTATATLPKGNWAVGAVSVSVTAKSARQDLIVPVQAVRQDQEGNFVLAVESQDTILGLQNVLVRLPATVEQKGDTAVSVSGPFDASTQIVVTSNKSVQPGDRVRIHDENA